MQHWSMGAVKDAQTTTVSSAKSKEQHATTVSPESPDSIATALDFTPSTLSLEPAAAKAAADAKSKERTASTSRNSLLVAPRKYLLAAFLVIGIHFNGLILTGEQPWSENVASEERAPRPQAIGSERPKRAWTWPASFAHDPEAASEAFASALSTTMSATPIGAWLPALDSSMASAAGSSAPPLSTLTWPARLPKNASAAAAALWPWRGRHERATDKRDAAASHGERLGCDLGCLFMLAVRPDLVAHTHPDLVLLDTSFGW